MIDKETKQKLLSDKRVIQEIHRHLWLESEKAGKDVGFDSAAAEWFDKFSQTWMEYHYPQQKKNISSKSFFRFK